MGGPIDGLPGQVQCLVPHSTELRGIPGAENGVDGLPMIGKTIGKYRIVGPLGRGGMGTVYKAVDETLDREVATQSAHPELADTDIIKRSGRKRRRSRANHPEIATIYELFRPTRTC